MVKTRFAPSPTGSLHIGGARTALYNYLYARKNQGPFVLRIEDTDQERHVEESQFQQVNDLTWLGLSWDEGLMPNGEMKGPAGSYRQSERRDIYRGYVDQFLQSGQAFYCFLSDEEIDTQRQQCIEAKKPFQLKSPWRELSISEAKQKALTQDYTIRFRNDQQGSVQFKDLVRGVIDLTCETVGDFVLMRSGGMPVYNFSCVVDDHLMDITHVLRGEEHLPNTLKQILIYRALGWSEPQFGHLSVIVGQDRKKLSKRDAAVSVIDFKKEGFLPEALVNGMALLGWSDPDGRDIISLSDMIEAFSIERLNAAPAAFDREKLLWINAQYIRAMSPEMLFDRLLSQMPQASFLADMNPEDIIPMIALYQTNVSTLAELCERLTMIVGAFSLSPEAEEVLAWPETALVLRTWQGMLHEDDQAVRNDFKSALDTLKEKTGLKGKFLFMPLRVAFIGQAHGAELTDLVQVMPLSVMHERLSHCLGD